MLYVPILKCKQGEKDALLTLQDNIKDQILPLLEVTPDIIEKGTFAGVQDFWVKRLFIFDISPEYYSEMSDKEYVALYRKTDFEFSIPTIKLADDEEKINELKSLSQNGLALRVYLEEILDDDFQSNYEDLLKHIDSSKTDLIIDAQSVEVKRINEVSFLVKGALSSINNIDKFRNVIFSSNSFPKSLEVERNKLSVLPRIESKLFQKVLSQSTVNLIYSDYSINHWTYFEFILGIQPSFNIRYTTENSYVIFKGETNKKGGLKIDKVQAACKLLTDSEYFLGKDYSWGDLEIHSRANGDISKSGNLTTWRAIGTNHHITLIVNHLSNQFES
ncbi:beta family protein [Halalkalibacter sp. APA_J-10(15)]|uniref:beta family protein n=1 Tax=Halalkalibacter sp. APA_J-10(15) TaxID=2933805 RepID=UPI001FF5DC35|nr:beta family protein [Halalkalibacter sp. APA_J-10(15)]MCK0470410.1 beta family protein [Halalkalibacter sp. APA_J-10(15)]